jgi:NAD(P)-dependent dehydrogenase (short-subunit alcohol dehydrogenase family)
MAWAKPRCGCPRRRGAKVIVGDILQSDPEIIAADIRAGGGHATAAKIDVTSEAESIDFIAKAVATYGSLDIWVNNAGISGSSVADPDGLEGWHRIIASPRPACSLAQSSPPRRWQKPVAGRS